MEREFETREFYRMNIGKLTTREMWRACPNIFVFAIAMFLKLFRIKPTAYWAIAKPHREDLIEVEELTDEEAQELSEQVAVCRDLGFRGDGVAVRSRALGNRKSWSIYFAHEDRRCFAVVSRIVDWNPNGRNELNELSFCSYTSSGKGITTSNAAMVNSWDLHEIETVKNGEGKRVYARHCQRLGEQRGMVETINSRQQLEEMVFRRNTEIVDRLLKRKMFIPITTGERKWLESLSSQNSAAEPNVRQTAVAENERGPVSTLEPSSVSGFQPTAALSPWDSPTNLPSESTLPVSSTSPSEPLDARAAEMDELEFVEPIHPDDADVLTGIRAKQLEKKSWATGLILLAVSVGAFVALGMVVWNWWIVAGLIPILFLHELGHYVAMRVLKYNNVRMFFLPLIGAAVSGRNFNASGWQRAVVALAGPVPGIVLGMALAVYSQEIGWPLGMGFAIGTIFINAINLVPFLPFDGGWVVQSVLLCRNFFIDFIFRVVAALFMVVVGGWMGSTFLLVFGALMLMQLKFRWNLAKVTTAMKRDGWIPNPANPREICDPTIREIVKRLRLQTNVAKPMRVEAALSSYELLGTKPPGVVASFLLIVVHAAAFFGSMWFIYSMVGGGIFQNVPRMPVSPEPVIEISSNEIVIPAIPVKSEEIKTLVVNCKSDQAVAAAMNDLARPGLIVSRVGQSAVIEIPEGSSIKSKKLIRQARTYDEEAYFDTGAMASAVSICFLMPGPDKADKLREQLTDYFTASYLNIIPPWSTRDAITDKQHHARSTYRQIVEELGSMEFDESNPLQEQIQEAGMDGDGDEVKRLVVQLHAERIQRQRKLVMQLRDKRPGLDKQVLNLYLDTPELDPVLNAIDVDDDQAFEAMSAEFEKRTEVWSIQMSGLLGEIPGIRGMPELGRESAYSGTVTQDGVTVNVKAIKLNRVPSGMQAIVLWLELEGATNIRYVIYNEFGQIFDVE